MAPIRSGKRSRRDDTEDVDNESTQDRRRTNGKRVRLSNANDDDSVMSDASEPEVQTNGINGTNGNHHTSLMDEVNSEPDEAAEQRASQLVARRYARRIGHNHAAEHGIIEEIVCHNFMCHTRLQVKFGPLINFIIGHNGSGKSAVLTALQLCLGTKAGATNRGGSLKAFIKHGSESATLAVRIKNQGMGAYQPDVYGPSITIERHFSHTSSGYKIKNSQGKIISTKRVDLEDITDTFAHQFDNPMTVLTQDQSRQFLHSSTPKDKYKFFMQGTQLKQLDADYKILAQQIDELERKVEPQYEDIRTLEKAYQAAMKRKQEGERQKGLSNRIAHLRRQMAWAQVEEQEGLLRDAEESVATVERQIQEATEKADEVGSAFDASNDQVERATEIAQELRETRPPAQVKLESHRDEFKSNSTQLADLMGQQRQIGSELKAANRTVATLSSEIREETQRQAAADGGAHATKVAEIQEAKAKAQEVKAALEEHGRHYAELVKEKEDAERSVGRMMPQLNNKREEIRNAESLIQNLRQDQGNWIKAYHPNMQQLLRAVEGERGFRERPVGPLGRHVQLLKPEWASILESSFGGSLNAFVVTSKQDQALLDQLMDRTKCRTNILIGDSRPIDTTRNEPDQSLLTWLRVLKIDNDLVRNQLIINQGIDQTVLIKDRNEGVDFMKASARPHNVRQCFTMHEGRPGDGVRIAISAGGENMAPVKKFKGRNRMQTDNEARINMEMEALNRVKRDLDQLERQNREVGLAFRNCNQAIERHRKEHDKLKLSQQRAEDLAGRLQDELEADTPQTGKLEALEQQLREAEEAVKTIENSFADCDNEKTKMNTKQRELKAQLDAAQAEVDEIAHRIEKAERKILKLQQDREKALREKNEAYAKIDDLKGEKVNAEEERTALEATVAEYIEGASQVSARVPVDEGLTWQILERRLEQYTEQRRQLERELGGDQKQLEELAAAAKVKLEAAKRNLKGHEDLAKKMKQALMTRTSRWGMFRKLITNRAKATFMYLLSERSFRGKLSIDHRNQALDISVEPDITKKSDEGRQSKTLSGGEKSFSTICVLLSLWEAMGAPIRCLDEFDVFMDNVNRDVSMGMMISAARNAVSKQFVLITPQSMGNVTLGADVRIIKLNDPERGQRALPENFTRA